MSTVVVVPAFEEQATVGAVVTRCRDLGYPVVVVDDGSTDGTGEVAEQAGAQVLRHPVNIGVGGALRTGFTWAARSGFHRAVQVDADYQHDPSSIDDLLAAADASGAGLVIGSRFGSRFGSTSGGDGYEMGRMRRFASRLLSRWVSRRVGTDLTDVTSGFRVVTQPLLGYFGAAYPAEYLGDTVEAVLIAHDTGVGIAEVPVQMHARSAGEAVPPMAAAGYLARLLMAVFIRKRNR